MQQKLKRRLGKNKQTERKSETPAAGNNAKRLREDADSSENDEVENEGQEEPEGSTEAEEQDDREGYDSFDVEGDAENTPLDPEVKSQDATTTRAESFKIPDRYAHLRGFICGLTYGSEGIEVFSKNSCRLKAVTLRMLSSGGKEM